MDGNPEKRTSAVEHLKRVIQASDKLGIGMVTTFIGRDQTKTVEENLEIVREVWPPIIRLAEEKKVSKSSSVFFILYIYQMKKIIL